MKTCTKCKRTLDKSCFHSRGRGRLNPWCKECIKEYGKLYRKINKETVRETKKRYTKTHPEQTWAAHSIYSHKCRGFTVTFTTKQLSEIAKYTKTCPICGEGLLYHSSRDLTHMPTLDVINCDDEILTLDNVQIMCCRCNMAKGKMSFKEFIKYCSLIVTLHGD